jgi:hypothetical protein
MAASFDTLSFAKRLTEAGEKPAVAEAHAMALIEFVMETVATKADIRGVREEIQDLRDEVGDVRGELKEFRNEVGREFGAVREEAKAFREEVRREFAAFRAEVVQEFAAFRAEVGQEFVSFRTAVGQEFASLRKEFEERFATKDDLLVTKQELRHEIGLLRKDVDAMGLKLTVRMGGMLVLAVGAVATLVRVL